jgi:F-type H+-transporting ATPase subunit c
MDILSVSVITAGVAIAIGTLGPGIGQGMAVSGAMQGIARQPEASNTIGTNLIIGLAFIESLTIYALVVSLLLLFANPQAKAARDEAEAKAQVEVVKMQKQLDELKQALPAASLAK